MVNFLRAMVSFLRAVAVSSCGVCRPQGTEIETNLQILLHEFEE